MSRASLGVLSALAFCFAAAAAAAASAVAAVPAIGPLNTGDPGVKRIDTMAVAPGGVLLIADGATSRIVAVRPAAGDAAARKPADGPRVPNLIHEIAGRLGAADKDVEVAEIAYDAATARTYVLVRKLDEKQNLIVTVDAGGAIAPLSLTNVPHTFVVLPKGENAAAAPKVTEMAWARDRLVCAARTGEEFASKLLVIPAPLAPESALEMISAETYHVAHRKWETKAPMAALFPYEEGGRLYIVGGFGCTPIVKYPVGAIQNGAKIKGESMIELGSGNRPMNMFAYTKDGKPSVIVNTFRFHHQKAPFGPSPYWACRFDQSILSADKVNEQAMRRDVKNPTDPVATVAEAFHGVQHMDKLDETRAIVVRENGGKLDLDVMPLP